MTEASFQLSGVDDNPTGWGPVSEPEHLRLIPFAPFSKTDKIGKAADWNAPANKYYGGRYQSNQGSTVFNFSNEEENNYTLVDHKPTQRKGPGFRRGQGRFAAGRGRRGGFHQRPEEPGRGGHQRQKQQQRFNRWDRRDQRQTVYSSSVDIRPEWSVLEQIQFSGLQKLSCRVENPVDLVSCGSLEYYDKAFDRVQPKSSMRLERTSRVFRSVTTSDDPILKKIAEESGEKFVFITDLILATLMCAMRSKYSWDIIITKKDGQLFFDKRHRSAIDMLTVNETAQDQVPEDKDNINGVQQLSLEATAINQDFSQQVLDKGGERFCFDGDNPFPAESDKEELASAAYRYRQWTLKDGIQLVSRCGLDAAVKWKGQDQLLAVRTLNEVDGRAAGLDWKQKLESQRGAVLAMELKNNANKLARWTVQATLAGADMIKLGYVARCVPADNTAHTILGTQMQKPKDFAMQMNLKMDNCWGIVCAIIDLCIGLDDGKYLLVKDPNKDLLRLYGVPMDAFAATYSEDLLDDDDAADGDEAVGGK